MALSSLNKHTNKPFSTAFQPKVSDGVLQKKKSLPPTNQAERGSNIIWKGNEGII